METELRKDPGGNSNEAKDCADELYEDDGRRAEDSSEHGGVWGSHAPDDCEDDW